MIVSYDPGEVTGVCTYKDEYNTYNLYLNNYTNPHAVLFNHLSNLDPELIIYEAFHHRQGKTGVVFKGVEYIGTIETFAQLNRIPVVVITPGSGKGFWDNRKLRALGLYNSQAAPHGMDALRVMLTYQFKDPEYSAKITQMLRDSL